MRRFKEWYEAFLQMQTAFDVERENSSVRYLQREKLEKPEQKGVKFF